MRRGIFQSGLAFSAICVAFLLFQPSFAQERKLFVVTTTSDLAYLAEKIGGNHVEALHLIRGNENPHYIDPRPDFIMKVNRADVFVEVGLDLEMAWSPVLLSQSRNTNIFRGAPGYCDASAGIHVLERPTSPVDRSMGHIHAFGNPHYWTDPLNAAIAARNIRDALIRVDPDSRVFYNANYDRYFDTLKRLVVEESRLMRRLPALRVAAFHRTFSYLSRRFGFQVALTIEEKPGVPPSAVYLENVIARMRRENIRIILIAPFENHRYAEAAAKQTGAVVIEMPLSVGSESGITSYEDSIRTMLSRLRRATEPGVTLAR